MKKNRIKTLIALLLIISMVISLTACGGESSSIDSAELIENDVIEEDVIVEDTILYDEPIADEVIKDSIIEDDNVYDCVINDDIICDIVLIDVVVGETTEDEIREQLPEEYQDYDIEWGKVIGKFAVGTSIIIAVGFIDYATNGQAALFFGTPLTITKDAFVGAVAGAAINTSINCVIDGKPTKQKLKKYTIEGAAEGYMWGAIASASKNIIRKQKLTFTDGLKAKILKDGTVVDKVGKSIGKAFYKGDKIYYQAKDGTIKAVFSSSGKELSNIPKRLPPNSILQLVQNGEKYYTDAKGTIYRVGDKLQSSVKYSLKGYEYSTDNIGRIKSFATNSLQLKDANRTRLGITDALETIAKGSQRAGDHRGHLFADLFNGDNSMANIVAMSEKLNLGEYKDMELAWEAALKAGQKVKVSGELVYGANSQRPEKIIVKYVFDNGDVITKVFVN